MATPNRGALITKMHRVLKKHYKPQTPVNRPVLDHLLFACLLENAHFETAEQAFAKLQASFFDLNEMRVSTVKELAELAQPLPDPTAAAIRFKRALQHVFESSYSYDLELLKKQNIGVADKALRKIDGMSSFTVAYVTQAGLGGHAIPLDAAAMNVLYAVGLVDSPESDPDDVPGLTRAIPKSKGWEFSTLLHELAADYWANPFSTNARNVLTAIAPEAKDRFPKRSTKRAGEESSDHPAETQSPPARGAEKTRRAAAAEETTGGDESAAKPRRRAGSKNGSPDSGKAVPPKARRMQSVSNKSANKGLAKRKPR